MKAIGFVSVVYFVFCVGAAARAEHAAPGGAAPGKVTPLQAKTAALVEKLDSTLYRNRELAMSELKKLLLEDFNNVYPLVSDAAHADDKAVRGGNSSKLNRHYLFQSLLEKVHGSWSGSLHTARSSVIESDAVKRGQRASEEIFKKTRGPRAQLAELEVKIKLYLEELDRRLGINKGRPAPRNMDIVFPAKLADLRQAIASMQKSRTMLEIETITAAGYKVVAREPLVVSKDGKQNFIVTVGAFHVSAVPAIARPFGYRPATVPIPISTLLTPLTLARLGYPPGKATPAALTFPLGPIGYSEPGGMARREMTLLTPWTDTVGEQLIDRFPDEQASIGTAARTIAAEQGMPLTLELPAPPPALPPPAPR